MANKKVNSLPNNYIVVEFIRSITPFIKGDITALPKNEYSRLNKLKAVKKL